MGERDPLKDIFLLRERLHTFFEGAPPGAAEGESGVWIPASDIYETAGEFVVKMELPGVGGGGVHISMERYLLKVSGERKSSREGKNYHRVERAEGAFSRSFVLPPDADRDSIRATLRDGILTIVFSRKAEGVPKQIEINR